jgi:hypothetical protein
MDLVKTFVKGRMNKSLDERLIPDGEYINAMNVRVGSTELSDLGSLENTRGNVKISTILYNDSPLNNTAICIGAFQDGVNNTIYWFIHSPVDNVDMIVSMNVETGLIVYHVISTSVLNFSGQHLINGVNKVEDLLFFTDGYNPPRKINVNRSYPSEPVLKESDISVIMAPPHEAPAIELINIAGEDNYIEDKFLSFAYRYRYLDGEYSATSQFSEIAFEPGFFNFDFRTFENSGMRNSFNAVNITFNTGGSRVVGIDLLFKNSVSNIINVIEKYDKRTLEFTDNSTHTVQFSAKKILTTLNESDTVRLFDNVPLIAKAQTVMSNRLFYGNYKDGYDIVDSNGKRIDVKFNASLVSEELGYLEVPTVESSSVYNIIPPTPQTFTKTLVTIDLAGVSLKEGGAIGIDLTLDGEIVGGPASSNNIIQSFYFQLQKNYSSVYELVTSQEFKEAIGSETFHATVDDCATEDQGTSLTDKISCEATPPTGFSSYGYGINTLGEGIKITATPGSSSFSLQMIVMVYQDDANPAIFKYEYFSAQFVSAEYISQSDASSLHSNRDYSLGIIYMDDFNRSTTVLVSENNSIHVQAKNSVNKNSIKVDILSQPPFWAKKYKFALLPSGLDYETIYSTLYFLNPGDGSVFLNLEGNNQNKAKIGDTLIVKRDSNGPVLDLIKCDVLDIVAKPENFIQGGEEEPAGLYMKVKPVGFAIDTFNKKILGNETINSNVIPFTDPVYPAISIPLYTEDPENTFTTWEIPEGSIITFDFIINRPDKSRKVGQRKYVFNKQFVAASNYNDLHQFALAQNIDFSLGDSFETGDEEPNLNEFIPALGTSYPRATGGVNKYQFFNATLFPGETGRKLNFGIRSGTPSQTGARSTITGSIKVITQDSIIVFETEPTEPAPAIYYEGSQTFDVVNGEHSEESIILNFSDCFTFANGVESYKIEDSLAAPYFRLGQRVSSVSGQDFQLTDRYASVTYSGIFNPENNVNKLNEFNLGLGNFKDLERRFGSIQKMSGRQTDILVLQEDKISYVLAGKNVLSDAAAGVGAIAAIPEVLGNQIARIEEYGISLNPESYVEWGFNKYFTDQKRGAVIQLAGAGRDENLDVISNQGMRPWFRDLFINEGDTQKLGGYDPYMDEYVLSSNDVVVTPDRYTIGCGTEIQMTNGTEGLPSTTVELGDYEGQSIITVIVDSVGAGETIRVSFVYDGVTYTTGNISTNQTLSFNKTEKDTGVLTVTQTGAMASYRIVVGCPDITEITVVTVTVNDKSYQGKVINDEYSVGTSTSTKLVSMLGGTANPIVSNYVREFGPEGFGPIPKNGDVVTIRSRKGTNGTMEFNPATHKLRYLISNTLYTSSNVLSLLNASTVATPVLNPSSGVYTANFTYATGSTYLYIIHDYRNIYSTDLCYSSVSAIDACCECVTEPL